MQIGFIGTGAITSSIVTGLSSSDVSAHSIRLSPRNSAIAHRLASRLHAVSVASGNQEVLDHCDTIVIAVRPPVAPEVLAALRFRSDHQVISLVSGLSLSRLSSLVAPAVRIARAVPLPSAAQRSSPTAIYPADPVALELFSVVGTAFPVESEIQFDAICATTATIASYLAFNDTIAAWLERQAIPAPQARDYVARLFWGEATVALESRDRSFQSLAASHTTAGGINEQFLKHLVEHGVLTSVSEGLDAVLNRIRKQS
jgi:pyrroline-5-carboxylate reductase